MKRETPTAIQWMNPGELMEEWRKSYANHKKLCLHSHYDKESAIVYEKSKTNQLEVGHEVGRRVEITCY